VKGWVHFVAFSLFLVAIGVARPSRAADRAETLLAEQVIHLLDYIGSDYGGAVSNGRVISEMELAEQIAVLEEAARNAGRVHPPASSRDPRTEVERVKRLVEEHRPAGEVTADIKTLRTQLAAFFDVAEAPRESPSRERGRRLYEQHCATCHGVDGRADTPRAVEYALAGQPRPANFHAPEVARLLSPARVFATTRFGVPKTAMVPFDFLSDAERWDIAFYTSELDHAKPPGPSRREARIFGLAELADESDDDLRGDLRSAGISEADVENALADLRLVAPYDAETLHPKGARAMLLHARASLKKVGTLRTRGDRDPARTVLLGAYPDDIEPIEGPLRDADVALARDIEAHFKEIRADIDRGALETEANRKLASLAALLGRARRTLDSAGQVRSFPDVILYSAGIALREGVEAALLIAALLAVVGRAGTPERKRWVHVGWTSAVAAGAVTWFAARRIVELSGLRREMLEGITALIAAAVLFYVSYWLFAKREAARWMAYLRTRAGAGNAALSLFGISFLAVYREAFETILFFQPIIAQPGARAAAAVGALAGAALLGLLVVAYGRAGRFAPPRSFFAFSTLLLYALAVVFAGQGIAALQTTGHLPLHPVALPVVLLVWRLPDGGDLRHPDHHRVAVAAAPVVGSHRPPSRCASTGGGPSGGSRGGRRRSSSSKEAPVADGGQTVGDLSCAEGPLASVWNATRVAPHRR
jgi:high-affinity iron transporter